MSKLTIIIEGADMKEWEARFKCSWIWQYEVETHEMNSTPNVRPHDIPDNNWGALLWRKRNQIRDINQNSRRKHSR